MGRDDADEFRRLIDRGLARYGRGELVEAIEEWRQALALNRESDEARTLIEFVQTKLNAGVAGGEKRTTDELIPTFVEGWEDVGGTDPVSSSKTPHRAMRRSGTPTGVSKTKQPTLESAVPEFLAQMTDPEWTPPADGVPQAPLHSEDTRRLGSEPYEVPPGRVPSTSETRAHDSASRARQRAAELVDRCRADLERGDYAAAALAAIQALDEDEQAPPPGIAEVIEPARPLFQTVLEGYVGPTQGIPVLAMSPGALGDLGLDHRAGFLMSRIDGSLTIDQLMDVAGMPRFEALRTLARLLRLGAIRLV